MKTCALAVLAALATVASAQVATLGEPIALDVQVDRVEWHPSGNSLLYTRTMPDGGHGIGVFSDEHRAGKFVLPLQDGDRWESQWFANSKAAIVIVYRSVPAEKSTDVAIHVLDVKEGSAQQVFLRRYPAEPGIEVNVDTSPLLQHALLRFSTGGKVTHAILPPKGTALIWSSDVDKAVAEGFAGPVWSKQGTATYVKGGMQQVTIAGLPGRNEVKTASFLTRQAELVLSSGEIRLSFQPVVPAPPMGTAVLELMPGNGAMRQVRFAGQFEEHAWSPPAVDSRGHQSRLQFGEANGSSNSLWLQPAKAKGTKDAVLIAAHADQAWISPRGNAVAYRTSGALFVRTIHKP